MANAARTAKTSAKIETLTEPFKLPMRMSGSSSPRLIKRNPARLDASCLHAAVAKRFRPLERVFGRSLAPF